MMRMLTPQQYADRLAASLRGLPTQQVPVQRARGLVLAAPVRAQHRLPAFDNSAMDGYAVRAQDVTAADVVLPVAGCIPAGRTDRLQLEPGTAWQIMTGAPMPDGADSIVQVELTDGGTEQVRFDAAAVPGASVRRAGEDVEAGQVVLQADTRIGARHMAALVGSGATSVEVTPRPRVAVISTGDELQAPGIPLQHGQITDSNAPMLSALVEQGGFEVTFVGHSDDTAEALLAVVREAAPLADAIITTGGVSAGEFEPLKAAFEGGRAVTFERIAMQPGKPQGFGYVDETTPLFALPGNPVSALVSFVMFVAPALRTMAGRSTSARWGTATAVEGWRTSPGRAQIARVWIEADGPYLNARVSGGPGSHLMGGLAAANGLAWIDAEVDQVRAGDSLRVLSLDGEFD